MAARWVIAFSLAAWLALIGSASLRQRARAQRGQRDADVRQRRLRFLGGPVLAIATIVGWLASPNLPAWLGVTVAAAAGVVLFGVIDDRRELPGLAHLAVFAAAAIAVAAAGVRLDQLHSDALDGILTVVWIVIVTSAFRRLEYAEGLTPATAALASAGLFGAAAASHDNVTATMCVALAGGCLGLLVYNARPASIVPGRAGASFAGFVLATAGIAFTPDTVTTGSLIVPLLVVTVPVLDLALVTASRLWHGIPLARPRHDHLMHRLRARGWSRTMAMGVLLAVQAVLTVVAVLVGRRDLAPVWGLVLGAGVAGALVIATLEVSTEHMRARRRTRGRLLLGLAMLALGIVAVLSAVAAYEGLQDVRSAQDALNTARAAARRGDTRAAEAAFDTAARSFDGADSWLDGPLGWPGRAVPVVSENLRAARELSGGGGDIARAGRRLAHASNTKLQVGDGTVNVAEVRRLTPDIEAATKLLHRVARDIDGLRRPYLLGPVRDRIDKADTALTAAVREADNGVAAAKVTPAVFGSDRPRRYFLAVQNNAELRATGGMIGSWGILTADNGKVTLDQIQQTDVLDQQGGSSVPVSARQIDVPSEFTQRYGRFLPAQEWRNLNMSPDFPIIGKAIADLYPQSGGTPIDGVIAVDPVGLQALLQLTGPVAVEGWPVPVTVDNVIDVTLRQAYDVYGSGRGQRVEFLGDVAEAVWKRATQMNLGSPARLASILGGAGRQGHLHLWFADPKEEALALRLDVGGAVPPVRSDSLLVTTQNASANKVDYYVNRHMDYTVQLDPDPSLRRARAKGTLELGLDNHAPAGISSVALGPFYPNFQPGEDRSFVSIYTPLTFRDPTLEGLPTALESGTELGRNVFSNFTSVPAGTSRALSMKLDGTIALAPGGWYTLDLPRQPTIRPDDVSVHVEVPPGWRIAAVEGLEITSPRRADAKIALDGTRQLRVKLARGNT